MRRRTFLGGVGAVAAYSTGGCLDWSEGGDLLLVGTGRLGTRFHRYLSDPGSVYALDPRSGEFGWAIEGVALGGSPVRNADTAFLPCETITDEDADPDSDPAEYAWGHNTGRLLAIDVETGDPAWSYTDEGGGFRELALDDGALYASTAESVLRRFDAEDGGVAWEFTDFAGVDPRAPRSTLADEVLVLTSWEHCWGVDVATGERAWTYEEFDGRITGRDTVDGTLYLADRDGSLHGVDAATGEREWTFEIDDPAESSLDGWLREVHFDGGTLYARDGDSVVYAVDPAAGEELWRNEAVSDASPPLVVTDDWIYVGADESGPGEDEEFVLYAIDGRSGEMEWSFDDFDGGVTRPVRVGTHLVGGSSWDESLWILDGETGDLVHDLSGRAGRYYATATDSVGELAYVTTVERDGTLDSLLGIDVREGEVVWEFDRPEYLPTVPPEIA